MYDTVIWALNVVNNIVTDGQLVSVCGVRRAGYTVATGMMSFSWMTPVCLFSDSSLTQHSRSRCTVYIVCCTVAGAGLSVRPRDVWSTARPFCDKKIGGPDHRRSGSQSLTFGGLHGEHREREPLAGSGWSPQRG